MCEEGEQDAGMTARGTLVRLVAARKHTEGEQTPIYIQHTALRPFIYSTLGRKTEMGSSTSTDLQGV